MGWKVSDQTLESWAWERVARGPGWVEAGWEGRGSEEEERSQCRMDPSEPPETRTGCRGCHVTA